MRRKNIIIYHNDPDGWASAWITAKFIALNINLSMYDECENIYLPFQYGKEEKINETLKEWIHEYETDKDMSGFIFLCDCTLTDDEIMWMIAEHCYWIDHHKSAMDRNTRWKTALLQNFTKLCKDRKIAACELAWEQFFPNKRMPQFVFLIGRYDVWALNNEVEDFNAYLNFTFGYTENKIIPCNEEFDKLQYDSEMEKALEKGKELRKWRKIFDSVDSAKSTEITTLFGYTVAINNRKGIYAPFFSNSRKKEIVDTDFYLWFSYNVSNKTWVINVRTNRAKDKNALWLLGELVAQNESTVITHGGHPDACGLTTTDINKNLLDHLGK